MRSKLCSDFSGAKVISPEFILRSTEQSNDFAEIALQLALTGTAVFVFFVGIIGGMSILIPSGILSSLAHTRRKLDRGFDWLCSPLITMLFCLAIGDCDGEERGEPLRHAIWPFLF